MRRFIRTITARRHVNFFVIQDGEAGSFEVLRWAAADAAPQLLQAFSYRREGVEADVQARGETRDEARVSAIKEATRLAQEENAKHAEELEAFRAARSDEEAERLAHGMTPRQQEKARANRL